MATSDRVLSRLQVEVLEAISDSDAVYLSGGAALAGYYLAHRQSLDLDFFTPEMEEVERLARRLRSTGHEREWLLELLQAAPGFQRFAVEHEGERTLIDIVHEPVHQEVPLDRKPTDGAIRYDALADLVANKLGALLGRGDVKDLVDLFFLERYGVDLIASLQAAHRKDKGIDPATLAWVASDASTQVSELLMLRPLSQEELRSFRDSLVKRLLNTAWPPEESIGE